MLLYYTNIIRVYYYSNYNFISFDTGVELKMEKLSGTDKALELELEYPHPKEEEDKDEEEILSDTDKALELYLQYLHLEEEEEDEDKEEILSDTDEAFELEVEYLLEEEDEEEHEDEDGEEVLSDTDEALEFELPYLHHEVEEDEEGNKEEHKEGDKLRCDNVTGILSFSHPCYPSSRTKTFNLDFLAPQCLSKYLQLLTNVFILIVHGLYTLQSDPALLFIGVYKCQYK